MARSVARGVAIVLVVLAVTSAMAQMTETPKIRFKQVARVKPNGDVELVNDVVFSTQVYTNLKKQITNTKLLLRELGMAQLADYVFVLSQQKQFVLMLNCQQAQSQQFQATFQQMVAGFQVR